MNPFLAVVIVLLVGVSVFYLLRRRNTDTNTSTSTGGSTTVITPSASSEPQVEDPRKSDLGTGEDLMSYTKRELLDMARERGVKVNQRMSKSSIASTLETQVNESE